MSIRRAPSTAPTASAIRCACSSPAVSTVRSRIVWTPSIELRSTDPMLPPASPIAVATRPSMPGRWSISTRRTIEYCAETGGMRPEDGTTASGPRRPFAKIGDGSRPRAVAARLRRRAGHDHVDPRHDDRQRRDRDARARARRAAVDDPVGRDRVSARARHRDPADRLGDGALRRQARVDDLGRAVPGRQRALRARLEQRVADRVPRAAGVRRRHDHADRAGDPGAGGGPAADGPDHERDRRADAARADPRPGDRRADRRQRVVALDLLRQRAGRHRGAGAGGARAAGRGGRRVAGAARRARAAVPLARAGGADLRAVGGRDRGRPRERARRRVAGRRRRAAVAVRAARAARRRAR